MRQCVIIKNITNSKVYSFEKYLKDISKYKILTPELEYELVLDMKKGDLKARELLILSNLRFVVSVAKQFQNSGLALADLVNEGNVGLMKALDNFDETKGFKFISYAVWWIRQSIINAISDNARIVRIPHNKINSLSKIDLCAKLLEQKFQREPTSQEIADETGFTVESVEWMLELSRDVVYMDVAITSDKEKRQTVEDSYVFSKYNDDSSGMFNSMSISKDIESCLFKLNKKEKLVLEMYFGLHGTCAVSFVDIAKKLGISVEMVKKIKNVAIEKIRKNHDLDLLKSYI